MRLPAPLLRLKPDAHKNDFGHVFILAGSRHMLGAAVLTALATMRAGAGLVTLGVPQSLNLTVQKKISPVIMTMSLPETREQSFSLAAFKIIEKILYRFDSVALGPGLSTNQDTQRFILKTIEQCDKPMVLDADALNALARYTSILLKNSTPKILTPHPGEMSRLTGLKKELIKKNRLKIVKEFAQKNRCVLILKGHRTIVAAPTGKTYINTTGNVGMATAGSGDVLTGIIAAFLAQGLDAFESARLAVYLHGMAGDLAAKIKSRPSLIATDIIENIPTAFLKAGGKK